MYGKGISATMTIPMEDLSILRTVDTVAMNDMITATLSHNMARQMHDSVVTTMANQCDMDTAIFMSFVKFLAQDPELRARFTAYRAARRLQGEF